jgi:hypothetical protein
MPHRAYDCPDCLQRLTGLRDCYDVRRRLYLAYVLFVSTCKIAKYMLSQQSHKAEHWRLYQLATDCHLNLSSPI